MHKIHVYSHVAQHEEVFIVGTQKSLEALKNAITLSLDPGRKDPGCVEAATCDGEGYDLVVIKVDDQKFEQLELPYPLPGLVDKTGISPWSLVSVERQPDGDIWHDRASFLLE